MNIVFEEDTQKDITERPIKRGPRPFLVNLLVKSGIAGGEKMANTLLVLLALLFFAISLVLFSIAGGRHYDNTFLDPRSVGSYSGQ